MEENNNSFEFPQAWVSIAYAKDPEKMANAVYFDFKQHLGDNISIPFFGIETMIYNVSETLKEYYSWEEGKIEDFIKKFKELIQYYEPPSVMEDIIKIYHPTSPLTQEGFNKIMKEMEDLSKKTPDHFIVLRPLSSFPVDNKSSKFLPKNSKKEIIKEPKINKIKKREKFYLYVKTFSLFFGEILLYWLALVGLFTLLGI